MVKTRKIALDSMLAAMCAALGYAALDFNNLKITFESLPILLGALLLGPVDGMAIGVVGTLIYQLIRYGGGEGISGEYMTDNLYTECAYYPESGKLVVINNSDTQQTTAIATVYGDYTVTLAPYDTTFVEIM